MKIRFSVLATVLVMLATSAARATTMVSMSMNQLTRRPAILCGRAW